MYESANKLFNMKSLGFFLAHDLILVYKTRHKVNTKLEILGCFRI